MENAGDYYSSVLNSIHDAIFVDDANTGQIIDVNQRTCELYGYDRETLLSLPIGDLSAGTPPYDQEHALAWLNKARTTGPQTFEWLARHKNGKTFWVEVSMRFVRFGEAERFVVAVRDISDRKLIAEELKASQETLRASEERFRCLIANSNDIFCLIGADGEQFFVSDAAERLTGFSPDELKGPLSRVIHPEDYPQMLREWAEGLAIPERKVRLEYRHIHKTQGYVWFEAVCPNFIAHPIIGAVVVNVRDITERKNAQVAHEAFQAQGLHAQKLESLGVLAGGIAHDFNNLLMAIMGNLELAMAEIPRESPGTAFLEKCLKASGKAADLTRKMLVYSGKGTYQTQLFDLNAMIAEHLELLRTACSRTHVFETCLSPDILPINADQGQIHQVLMNLLVNASEAHGSTPGIIRLATGKCPMTEADLQKSRATEKPPAGTFAWLEIADMGSGMDEHTLSRIFDPFFSTKFTGRGMGLPAVMGIVRSHHGAIFVESSPGRGTQVKVLLPLEKSEKLTAPSGRSAVECLRAAHAQTSSQDAGSPVAQRPLILLADDEDTILQVGCSMLDTLGYDCLPAHHGREAVTLFQNHSSRIAAVILDLSMPHLDGLGALAEIRALAPNTRVLLTSGFSEDDGLKKLHNDRWARFLQKPFRLATLQAALREILPPPPGSNGSSGH